MTLLFIFFSFEHSEPMQQRWPPLGAGSRPGGGPNQAVSSQPAPRPYNPTEWVEMTVTLLRQDSGFGFRIVGGTEEGSQVSIGHIVPGGAADVDGRLFSGDEIVAVDNTPVLNTSHHQVRFINFGHLHNSNKNSRIGGTTTQLPVTLLLTKLRI